MQGNQEAYSQALPVWAACCIVEGFEPAGHFASRGDILGDSKPDYR